MAERSWRTAILFMTLFAYAQMNGKHFPSQK